MKPEFVRDEADRWVSYYRHLKEDPGSSYEKGGPIPGQGDRKFQGFSLPTTHAVREHVLSLLSEDKALQNLVINNLAG